MIEAELKTKVRFPDKTRALLSRLSPEEVSVYKDTYFDFPGELLGQSDRELRIRIIEVGSSSTTTFTYKEAAVDVASQSKPEYETHVNDTIILDKILTGIGLRPVISFEKHCSNYAFAINGQQMKATLVEIPEVEEKFLEVETLVTEEESLGNALRGIRQFIQKQLGISEKDFTTELYTDIVRRLKSK
jgi:adenylate cyclase class 2